MKSLTNLLEFDLDEYLNPYIPRPHFDKWPRPIAHFLGYRAAPAKHVPRVIAWLWGFLGAFCGISLIMGVGRASPWIQSLNPPVIVASYGAAAILEYNTIESPLAQPRNMLFGQFFSATFGVCITKLFMLLPPDRFQDYQWLAGALCVATASFVMGITKTIHPPAGATALLTATNPQIMDMGWSFIPLVLISDALMLGSACLLNNIQRRFPEYWWAPGNLGKDRTKKAPIEVTQEKSISQSSIESPMKASDDLEEGTPGTFRNEVLITADKLEIPEWLDLGDIVKQNLREIQDLIKEAKPQRG